MTARQPRRPPQDTIHPRGPTLRLLNFATTLQTPPLPLTPNPFAYYCIRSCTPMEIRDLRTHMKSTPSMCRRQTGLPALAPLQLHTRRAILVTVWDHKGYTERSKAPPELEEEPMGNYQKMLQCLGCVKGPLGVPGGSCRNPCEALGGPSVFLQESLRGPGGPLADSAPPNRHVTGT